MYDAVGYLISETESTNAYGDNVTVDSERMVYVKEMSVRQSEFYQAQVVGLKPELMFEMRRAEYQNEPKFKYDDKVYVIIRTFEKNRDFIEIICQGVVNGVK